MAARVAMFMLPVWEHLALLLNIMILKQGPFTKKKRKKKGYSVEALGS